MSLTAMKIQALVRDMDSSIRRHKRLKTSNPAEYRNKIVEENKVLHDELSCVFEMHFEGKLDETFFEMLRLKRKIEKGEMTEDQASREIGQKLFDHYVGPVVNNTPAPEKPLSYEEYYNQFNKS
jgi:hypothetical protein